MPEPRERARGRHQHGEALAPPETPALQVAVHDHQRVEADRAVIDEDALVHLADVHKAFGAGGDQFRRLLQIRGNSEVAREMVERSERQDAKLRFCPGQRRGRGAYCPITAADDQYWVAPLADGLGADLAVASRDQLDLTIDPRR